MRRLAPTAAVALMLAAYTMNRPENSIQPPVPESIPTTEGGYGRVVIDAFLKCCFVEGGHFFLLLEDDEGSIVLSNVFAVAGQTIHVRRVLPVGDTQVFTWARSCPVDGPCTTPDRATAPPGDACYTDFDVAKGEPVHLRFDDAIGCDVKIS